MKDKSDYVKNLFNKLAVKYDFMNDLITGGLHRNWKTKICKLLKLKSDNHVLDIACGTGDICFKLQKKYSKNNLNITGIDFSENMLDIARKKNKYKNIEFLKADALNLPFEDNFFDAITLSYALRNMSDYKTCLLEANRVCKKNGQIIILDMSYPNKFTDLITKFYRFTIIPILGKIFVENLEAYSYLTNSIYLYLKQEELCDLLKNTGWYKINYTNLLGGISSIHQAKKLFYS
jgi:ubiquinone/menaquinone biosynthesis methyltransferase